MGLWSAFSLFVQAGLLLLLPYYANHSFWLLQDGDLGRQSGKKNGKDLSWLILLWSVFSRLGRYFKVTLLCGDPSETHRWKETPSLKQTSRFPSVTGFWRGRAKWQPLTASSKVGAVTIMGRVSAAAKQSISAHENLWCLFIVHGGPRTKTDRNSTRNHLIYVTGKSLDPVTRNLSSM